MEIGIGIHGESGNERKEITSADDIAKELTEQVLDDFDFTGEAAVMINGLGSTPEMELYIVNRKVQAILADRGITVYKRYVGGYMTSMKMTGSSVTVMN